MLLQIRQELIDDRRNCFRSISDLQDNDPSVLLRRISNEISKVSIQGEQNGTDLLSLLNHSGIFGVGRKPGREPNDLVPCDVRASMIECGTQ